MLSHFLSLSSSGAVDVGDGDDPQEQPDARLADRGAEALAGVGVGQLVRGDLEQEDGERDRDEPARGRRTRDEREGNERDREGEQERQQAGGDHAGQALGEPRERAHDEVRRGRQRQPRDHRAAGAAGQALRPVLLGRGDVEDAGLPELGQERRDRRREGRAARSHAVDGGDDLAAGAPAVEELDELRAGATEPRVAALVAAEQQLLVVGAGDRLDLGPQGEGLGVEPRVVRLLGRPDRGPRRGAVDGAHGRDPDPTAPAAQRISPA
eukprot:TRINITY_DN25616_c0_g1_i1.p2 TRINITY_DN25616_c0_g1~~TRINITY_DN25616_c0_g1_i1.p2  ORF type:complete len:267 (-),score=37.55 TRINITY_DN25616_c0_g1_i1:133-933(-)